MKKEIEGLLKEYKSERKKYLDYIKASDNYLELLKERKDYKKIKEEKTYRYGLVVRANTYSFIVEDLQNLLGEGK